MSQQYDTASRAEPEKCTHEVSILADEAEAPTGNVFRSSFIGSVLCGAFFWAPLALGIWAIWGRK